MSTPEATTETASEVSARGLRYARNAGYVLTLLLLVFGLGALLRAQDIFGLPNFLTSLLSVMPLVKDLSMFMWQIGVYFMVYGIVISLPYARMSDSVWRKCYGLLVGFSALFVFVMVAVVMFAYMAADARGERLGVPGLEGTLIFLALLQVPVVLFQRKPDLLD